MKNEGNGREFYEKFIGELKANHNFPGCYTYKFVLPTKQGRGELDELFRGMETAMEEKESAKGTYTSYSITANMPSAESVAEVYKKAEAIKNIISL